MKYDYDLAIIGGGSAGIVAAELAANMSVKAALIEAERIGGDCLWTGCVPSKAILASARVASTVRGAAAFGVSVDGVCVDTAAVWARMKRIRESIAATDDAPGRFVDMGVDVLQGRARFAGSHRIEVAGRKITARYALVCTGSRPALADIPGLDESVCLTSENIFELDRAPASLAIIGAGPIGVEMAQAMNRLGVETSLLEFAPQILPREEPALTGLLSGRLAEEGVRIGLGVAAERAETAGGLTTLYAGDQSWQAERVLVATGRRPTIDDLALDAVGVKTNRTGIVVDGKLRTNVPWVYAAGDCAGRYLFTHSAAAEAAVALRNMFYPGSSSAYAPVPWTTFTDPELAHVGLTEAEARKRLGAGKVRVHEWDLSHSDRARADGDDLGGIIAVTDSKDRIIGAHVLAPHAGDVISQFTIAIHKKMRLTPDFNEIIQVYPTYATGVQQLAADAIYGKLKEPFYRLARRVGSLLG
ncbi:MAG: FAD-dependent oxidoreductase [Alphaproteobacteria bacterium]